MLGVIDSLIVELGLDPSDFDRESKNITGRLTGFKRRTGQAAKESEEHLKSIADAFDGMAKRMLGYVTGFFTARAALSFAKGVIETNRNLGNLADTMQENIQRLSALGNTFDRLGGQGENVLQTIEEWDTELKGLEMTAGDPTQSRLIKFLNHLGTFGKIQVNPFDATGKQFRKVSDIFIEVSEKLARSNLDERTKALLLSPQSSGIDRTTAAVMLRGGAAMGQHIEDQKKIFAVTEEQRKKTDELNRKWIELGQTAKRLGQEVLVSVSDGLIKLLDATKAFIKWCSDEFSNPKSILFLPTIDKIKTFFFGGPGRPYTGGKEGKSGIGWPRTVDGGSAGRTVTGSDGKTHWQGGEPTGTGYFFPGTSTKLGGGLGGYSASMGPGRHGGDDVMMPHGSPLHATKGGKVLSYGRDNQGGLTMTVRHSDGSTTTYMHMSERAAPVGSDVSGGQIIGKSGTANSVPHLHLEMRDPQGRRVSPRAVLGYGQPAATGNANESKSAGAGSGGWSAPLTAVPFLNFKPIILRRPNVSNTTKTEINSVTVNSQATDAAGIAADIASELRRQVTGSSPVAVQGEAP